MRAVPAVLSSPACSAPADSGLQLPTRSRPVSSSAFPPARGRPLRPGSTARAREPAFSGRAEARGERGFGAIVFASGDVTGLTLLEDPPFRGLTEGRHVRASIRLLIQLAFIEHLQRDRCAKGAEPGGWYEQIQ